MTADIDKKEQPCPDCWYVNTQIYCIWEKNCHPTWIQFQKTMNIICEDPFMDLFITLCIVVNTAFMAMEHKPITPKFDNLLTSANLVSKNHEKVDLTGV